ncbi:Wzz/FepE/Etk N-terminal domain-containing protein [Shewanella dokdonensis]|uniref:LPS O-antigen length regulator n=1 Tax=Shewanella dokdonensis TaxID=712036 RepID=A0ABX8DG25_9GAMM|nr:Wzz/FepE/Etk N-terminal domain-containing protein [Shewanella dokdonensis]MCL1073905.1 Wzz/FepE/Etk N-terminal domain-containing protein [Shewanella dokdonensis]QVK23681.1 LPS O-antigen length regulator [Shewanella dokdonensis]
MSNTISNPQDAEFSQRHFEANDEIDLRELFGVIWAGKALIISITLLFAVASVALALRMPNIYKSEALLAPAAEAQGGGLSALANQFGGLASLAGLNFGRSGSTDKTKLAIEVMKSRKFTSDFIGKHHILPELMAVDKWSLSDNKISYDPELYDINTKEWVRQVKPPLQATPSMQEAYKKFTKIFSVTGDKQSGLVTVSVEHKSPYVAKQWVDWLVSDINQVMKQRDVTEAKRSTEYLEKQIEQTNVADIRTVLYKLVEEQAKTIMFAEVRDEYIFKTVDPALVPEEKFKPKRALICVLGTLLGGMLAVFIVLVRYFVKKRN